jgi:hypothetical protein
MKKLLFAVLLFCLLAPCFVFTQSEGSCQGWTCKFDYTLGLAGVGFFFTEEEKEYVANIGGLVRIFYPVIERVTTEGRTNLIDFGVTAYITGGEIRGKTGFFGGGGLTLGFVDGLLSFSFGPSFVYADVPNFDGCFFWGVIFTSRAVSIR